MCIIIYTPDGNIPKKQLKNSLDYNADGWGIMWPEDGVLQICTGMGKAEFFKEWKWIGKIKAPKVFHARIGTHGTTSVDNCHPFAIPGHGQLAVVHNGVINQQAVAGSDKSDTRHFVDNILAKLPVGFLTSDGVLDMMAKYVGYSKLVFMDGTGTVYIVNAEMGNWYCERWYSNNSCFGWRAYSTSGVNVTKFYDATKAIGFQPSTFAKPLVQADFPVFKEDEVAVERARIKDQHSSYDDYDKASDEVWQTMVQQRQERAAANAGSCGIGLPAAITSTAKTDDAKTGLAAQEEWKETERQRRLRKLEAVIRARYPENSQGAIAWRAKNNSDYPCKLPDPAGKYAGYTDMM